jgi:hypothetical protein
MLKLKRLLPSINIVKNKICLGARTETLFLRADSNVSIIITYDMS